MNQTVHYDAFGICPGKQPEHSFTKKRLHVPFGEIPLLECCQNVVMQRDEIIFWNNMSTLVHFAFQTQEDIVVNISFLFQFKTQAYIIKWSLKVFALEPWWMGNG